MWDRVRKGCAERLAPVKGSTLQLAMVAKQVRRQGAWWVVESGRNEGKGGGGGESEERSCEAQYYTAGHGG